MRRHSCNGFILIELMLVVGIIGILAAVGMPAYQDYLTRTRIAEALALAQPIQKTVRDYRDRWGVFPSDNAEAGLYAAEHYAGQYVKSIEIEQGVVSIVFNGVDKALGGQELHLTPAVNDAFPTAPFAWVCESHAPPPGMKIIAEIPKERLTLKKKYAPSVCRS